MLSGTIGFRASSNSSISVLIVILTYSQGIVVSKAMQFVARLTIDLEVTIPLLSLIRS